MLGSIRLRLTLSHLLVIVIAMGFSGLLLLSFLDDYFTQAAEDSLLAQARITVQALLPGASLPEPSAEGELPLAASNTLQQRQLSNLSVEALNWGLISNGDMGDASLQLSADLTTHIRILDLNGIVVLDSLSQELGMDLGSHPLVAQALGGRAASVVEDDLVMSLAYPAMQEGELQGVILLSQPLDDVAAVLSDLRGRWLLATGIALLLSGVLGLLLSGAIARPLRRLTEAAGAVADGELDQQVPVRSRDEIGRLSMVFNEMTARLRAARQMQIDFVANVSHELRTPLTAVKGTVETLRDGAVDDPEVRDRFLGTVESETDRLIRLVNDLLLLSRADSEALNLRPDNVDLNLLLRQTVDRLRPAAEKRGIELEVSLEQNCSVAWADRDRIEQVLLNLLDNGIKYSRPGGHVLASVRIDLARSCLLVEIADQGEGIPAEELPYIGRRFYRADRARSRSRGGSGLGLAIARALVEAHGGTLELESQESRGTRVRFTLPTAGAVSPRS
jgi:signal transduction histidine kinase